MESKYSSETKLLELHTKTNSVSFGKVSTLLDSKQAELWELANAISTIRPMIARDDYLQALSQGANALGIEDKKAVRFLFTGGVPPAQFAKNQKELIKQAERLQVKFLGKYEKLTHLEEARLMKVLGGGDSAQAHLLEEVLQQAKQFRQASNDPVQIVWEGFVSTGYKSAFKLSKRLGKHGIVQYLHDFIAKHEQDLAALSIGSASNPPKVNGKEAGAIRPKHDGNRSTPTKVCSSNDIAMCQLVLGSAKQSIMYPG